MYSITVRNNILIAHSLPGEVFGPAQNMHGATYVVDAEFFAKKVNKYNIINPKILANISFFFMVYNIIYNILNTSPVIFRFMDIMFCLFRIVICVSF